MGPLSDIAETPMAQPTARFKLSEIAKTGAFLAMTNDAGDFVPVSARPAGTLVTWENSDPTRLHLIADPADPMRAIVSNVGELVGDVTLTGRIAFRDGSPMLISRAVIEVDSVLPLRAVVSLGTAVPPVVLPVVVPADEVVPVEKTKATAEPPPLPKSLGKTEAVRAPSPFKSTSDASLKQKMAEADARLRDEHRKPAPPVVTPPI